MSMFCAMPRTFENKQTTSEPLPREIQKTLYLSSQWPPQGAHTSLDLAGRSPVLNIHKYIHPRPVQLY